ncbi:right-handed parallel beta-helix repeat-containing protein [Paenibacillus solisilvae]|uniref:Right-handed parallel beta-helix repeat-containing protein n=1 Tax=Paenibacillus solisilvae TaxID=2486751 RepID=A0ABW0W954_9BACL
MNEKLGKTKALWVIRAAVFSLLTAVSYFYFFHHDSHQAATINVKTDFNAHGDGIHDDTNAIQAAIDSVAKGGTIVIPPGVYKISKDSEHRIKTGYGISYSAIKISKPLTLIMNGAVFLTSTEDKYGAFWIYKTSEVHLKGGSLKGNVFPTDGIYTSRVGVLVQECDHCSIEDMNTQNFSQGLNIYQSTYTSISKVTSENNHGSGIINFSSHHTQIDSCAVRNSSDGHISLYGGGTYNTVTNCKVTENRKGYPREQGITVETEKYSLIKNNTVSGFFYGIDIKNGSDSDIIELNKTYNNQYNIIVRAGDPGRNLQTISNNIQILKNTVTKPRAAASNAGIVIQVGRGHVVQENVIDEGKLRITDGIENRTMKSDEIKVMNNIFIKRSDSYSIASP